MFAQKAGRLNLGKIYADRLGCTVLIVKRMCKIYMKSVVINGISICLVEILLNCWYCGEKPTIFLRKFRKKAGN